MHGANVPLGEAQQVVAALRERGASPAFLLFDDEGHEVRGRENRAVLIREVVGWVTTHVGEMSEQIA